MCASNSLSCSGISSKTSSRCVLVIKTELEVIQNDVEGTEESMICQPIAVVDVKDKDKSTSSSSSDKNEDIESKRVASTRPLYRMHVHVAKLDSEMTNVGQKETMTESSLQEKDYEISGSEESPSKCSSAEKIYLSPQTAVSSTCVFNGKPDSNYIKKSFSWISETPELHISVTSQKNAEEPESHNSKDDSKEHTNMPNISSAKPSRSGKKSTKVDRDEYFDPESITEEESNEVCTTPEYFWKRKQSRSSKYWVTRFSKSKKRFPPCPRATSPIKPWMEARLLRSPRRSPDQDNNGRSNRRFSTSD